MLGRKNESDGRLVSGGPTRTAAIGIAVIGALLITVAVLLDHGGALDDSPLTSNIVAGLLAVPATAVIALIAVDRIVRSEEERRIARRIYYAARKLEILARGFRMAMYRAYLGTDSVKENTLDTALGRRYDKLVATLRANAAEEALALMHEPTPFEITEVLVRADAVIAQANTFADLVAETPYQPGLAFTLGSLTDRAQFHRAAYATVLGAEFGYSASGEVGRRLDELAELAFLLEVVVEISNLLMRHGEAVALRFGFVHWEEDRRSPEEIRRQIAEVLQAQAYKLEDQ